MDSVERILDWLSANRQNLSEDQKKEVYDLLNSLRGQFLETRSGMGPTGRNPQLHRIPAEMNRDEKKYHGRDQDPRRIKVKLDSVASTINKETGYINSKIDIISKDCSEQIETLKKKVRELEIEKNHREQENKKVSDREIDQITGSLKNLMNDIKESRSFPPNTTWSDLQGAPSYVASSPVAPIAKTPYFAHPHIPPQFHPASSTCGPPMVPPFLPSKFGPNPGPCQMNQNVYRFVGGWNSVPIRGTSHPRPRFDKPALPRGNDEKFHGHGKKYCDSFWKKFDHTNKEQGFRNESSNSGNLKSQHKMASLSEQQPSGGDSSRGKFHQANRFKNHADQGKNKRYQQFGKNRPQNSDDGAESDSSVSSKSSRKEFSHKLGHTHNLKFPLTKNSPSSTGKNDDTKLRSHEGTKNKDTPIPPRTSKNFRKEFSSKPPHPCNFTSASNKTPQVSSSKTEVSNLEKLQYPSKVEALKQGIDINKKFSSPSTCLAKQNGMPVTCTANCLQDIYDFEKEFGSCQVVRF